MTNEPLIANDLNAELSRLYLQTGRHYHNLAHIEALLALLDEYRAEFDDPEAVVAAIWFHDAIYDSRRSDNEALSAELARDCLYGRAEPERIDRIVAMIEATATHALPPLLEQDRDAAMFLDMDLSILGARPRAFDAYEAAVRREYDWVEDDAWRTGRAGVLRRFLERDRIFRTEIFRQRYESAARQNIERSLARLTR